MMDFIFRFGIDFLVSLLVFSLFAWTSLRTPKEFSWLDRGFADRQGKLVKAIGKGVRTKGEKDEG
jgi:hypothetical protein